jgi:hypothetical protein
MKLTIFGHGRKKRGGGTHSKSRLGNVFRFVVLVCSRTVYRAVVVSKAITRGTPAGGTIIIICFIINIISINIIAAHTAAAAAVVVVIGIQAADGRQVA